MKTHWLTTARLPSEALVQAAIDGTDHDVDALARVWLPHVYRWCHRMGGPGFDAEDSAHEVLILMCRKIHGLRDPAVFPSWLFGITRRVIANHRRRAWWKRWMPGEVVADRPAETGGPEQSYEARRAHERVWKALENLSDRHREVLVLCDLEERSGSEAAALLGVPLGTVKSRLRTARQSFKKAVESELGAQRSAQALGGAQ